MMEQNNCNHSSNICNLSRSLTSMATGLDDKNIVSEILPAEDVVKQQNGNYNMKT